jgi:membrane protein DedA with SNARE-associated domain
MIEALHYFPAVDLTGLPAATLFTALFFATFVSEDAACIAAGTLAASGAISLPFAIASCFLGIVAGDIGLYWIGRVFGRRLMSFTIAKRFVSENALARGSQWLERRGASAVFLSRFVTGLRLPTYLAAGFLRTSFGRFTFYFILAAAIWTPLLVGSVALSWEFFGGSVLVAAVAAFVIVRVVMKLGTWRGRRIATGKLRRILRWEFWPLPVFYFPVVVYVLLLALRYRSLTVFTCANPSIPSGGFVGESKDAIYAMLASSPGNRPFVLRHDIIPGNLEPDGKAALVERFIAANHLSFPIVLKPDVGERGKGVRIVDSSEMFRNVLASTKGDQILQEFAGGSEISVFYYRHPGAAAGRIFSITEKVFPHVVGDGASTLEELILSDDRAVCLAEKYFEENRSQLGHVPTASEDVRIIRIGTHSRGAVFLDGERLRTHELESAIDMICRRIEGFNFGRFDIRYSSEAELMAGRGFKIVELNGVTSESTNIYDPRYSLFDAYRILFQQWRIAFEIGAENRRLGADPTPESALIRAAFSAVFAGPA